MRNLSSMTGRRMRMRAFAEAGGVGGVAVPLADGRGWVGVALGFDAACSGMEIPLSKWSGRCVLGRTLARLLDHANQGRRLWPARVVRGINVRTFQALGGEGAHRVTP
jgi:hypothetical protein